MGTWFSMSEGMLKSEAFGADLDRNNGWMDEEMKGILKGASGPLEKARNIYSFERDHFTCTDHFGLTLDRPLKTVFKEKNGNVAELNLLLTAMLRHAGISADPVMLSTRGHGFTHEIYPLISRFNYVIARAMLDGKPYFLDASETWLGFGRIPEKCYNGHARVVNKEKPLPVYFEADSVTEGKTTLVFINNESKGVWAGRLQSAPGYFESCKVREKVKSKGKEDFFKTVKSGYAAETSFSDLSIDSLKEPDMPLNISYEFKIRNDTSEDILYFNPMLTEARKENPFKAAERVYPVEMPYAMDEIYTLNMEIPDGYTVDELPKSAKVSYNEDEGFFEYLIAKDESGIQFRSRVKLKKANFKPEDYSTLRDFFAYVVKKESEQIVFKKKK
jgi:Domain of Unknown Function with PDB structure (DUF3858)/Transglutaminase-like superfamily